MWVVIAMVIRQGIRQIVRLHIQLNYPKLNSNQLIEISFKMG